MAGNPESGKKLETPKQKLDQAKSFVDLARRKIQQENYQPDPNHYKHLDQLPSPLITELAAYATLSEHHDLEIFLNSANKLEISYTLKETSHSETFGPDNPIYKAIFPETHTSTAVTKKAHEKLAALAATPKIKRQKLKQEIEKKKVQNLENQEAQNTQKQKILTLLLSIQDNQELANKSIETLKQASIEDLRRKSDLLIGQHDQDPTKSVTQEFLLRLNAYTSQSNHQSGETLYTLNYQKFGIDKKGRSHEMFIGLGDVILDPRIDTITVFRKDGTEIQGYRGIAQSGKHKGRVAFLDASGKYIATRTGDSFIMHTENYKPEQSTPEITEQFQQEEQARQNHEIKAKNHETLKEFHLTPNSSGRHSPLEDSEIQSRLDSQGANGEQIIAFARERCEAYGIPYEICKNLINKESKWDIDIENGRSSASGLGQFLDSTFEGYQKEINPNAQKDNPFDSIDATVWLMSKTKKYIPDIDSKTLYEQGIIYYAFHHEGTGAAPGFLKFFNKMEEIGAHTPDQIRAAYQEHKKLLHHKTRERVSKHGVGHLLTIFKFGQTIGSKAQAEVNPLLAEAPTTPENLPEHSTFTLAPNQKTWIFGSSIARGIKASLNPNIGVFGIRGRRANNFLPELQKQISLLKQIEPKPQRVLLLGFAHNAGTNPENMNTELQNHKQIINLIQTQLNIPEVKIVQAHTYPNGQQAMQTFNQLTSQEGLLLQTNQVHVNKPGKPGDPHPNRSQYNSIAQTINQLDNNTPTNTIQSLETLQGKTGFQEVLEQNPTELDIKINKLSGNGNRPVAIIKSPNFDPNKPSELAVHFHGTYSENIAKANVTNKKFRTVSQSRFAQTLQQAQKALAKNPNLIIAYPTSNGPQKPGHKSDVSWMQPGRKGDNFDLLVQELTDNKTPSKITLTGHSAGGQPLRNIAKAIGEGKYKTKVDHYIFLDASYGKNQRSWLQIAASHDKHAKFTAYLEKNNHKKSAYQHTKTVLQTLAANPAVEIKNTRTKHSKMIETHLLEALS